MGAYNAHFTVESHKQIKNLKPSNPQWIFKHAEACGMPFAEVVRCWRRFVLLGANSKGMLTQQSKIWQSEDKFVQQVLRQLPWNKKHQLSFQSYLKVCAWFKGTEPLIKLKVIYEMLNNGKPITSDILQKILKHVYPDDEQENLEKMADNFVKQADVNKLGYVDEEQFIDFTKKIPFEEFAAVLSFDIIPIQMQNLNLEDD
uniref:Uncharacterized protein LOC100185292 n=1 Tax=Phallusia mammillata TaxID=59560 RepID=A0A6F9DIW1_9ASCI|nr:uncharacterized protein LOC100185292 [Phallusia mammillata]